MKLSSSKIQRINSIHFSQPVVTTKAFPATFKLLGFSIHGSWETEKGFFIVAAFLGSILGLCLGLVKSMDMAFAFMVAGAVIGFFSTFFIGGTWLRLIFLPFTILFDSLYAPIYILRETVLRKAASVILTDLRNYINESIDWNLVAKGLNILNYNERQICLQNLSQQAIIELFNRKIITIEDLHFLVKADNTNLNLIEILKRTLGPTHLSLTPDWIDTFKNKGFRLEFHSTADSCYYAVKPVPQLPPEPSKFLYTYTPESTCQGCSGGVYYVDVGIGGMCPACSGTGKIGGMSKEENPEYKKWEEGKEKILKELPVLYYQKHTPSVISIIDSKTNYFVAQVTCDITTKVNILRQGEKVIRDVYLNAEFGGETESMA